MNTKQVAGWMREAANQIEILADETLGGTAEFEADKVMQRAAQVEAMTCDGCRWWAEKPTFCENNWMFTTKTEERALVGQCGPKFGCTHWEAK